MVEEQGGGGVRSGDAGHLVAAEGEVENVEVQRHPLGSTGSACKPKARRKRQPIACPRSKELPPKMTITMTRVELAATLRALADGLASVDTFDPEAPGALTRIADRLSELAAQEHEPEIVTTMRTVAARCVEVAEAITRWQRSRRATTCSASLPRSAPFTARVPCSGRGRT